MIYSIEKSIFEGLAAQIIEQYNFIKNTNVYKIEHVEIHFILQSVSGWVDNTLTSVKVESVQHDMISRALIRNPSGEIYDMVSDVQGTPKEALELMLKTLKQQADKLYKIKNSRYN